MTTPTHRQPAVPTEKILVAIHGIGEQVRCETIQAVASQLCRYYGLPTSIPLGHLNAQLVRQEGDDGEMTVAAYMVTADSEPTLELPPGFGFSEVYWAEIPRKLATDRYHLEESKKWAMTVVDRVRAMDRRSGRQVGRKRDYDLAGMVIAEMADGLKALENVLFLADRANIFKFDLKQVLVEYLGDVQVVSDFESLRRRIVGVFLEVMTKIHEQHPKAEIYLVAHSEGTVISLLGILDSLCRLDDSPPHGTKPPPNPEWVTHLRGLMTIGSPLNKHLILWPELWNKLTTPPRRRLTEPIQWRNYYDFGDPVGFRLDTTREWLKDKRWMGGEQPFFEFDESKDDIGFGRYYFPGKAHTDYWTDEGVFGHFIQDVVKPAAWKNKPTTFKPPRNRFWARLCCTLMPFLWAFVLLLAGVYVLYKAVNECLSPNHSPPVLVIGQDVLAIGLLLAGITVAIRLPRLTRAWRWRLGGFVFLLVSLWGFQRLLTKSTRDDLLLVFFPLAKTEAVQSLTTSVADAPSWLGLAGISATSLLLIGFAVVLVVVGRLIGRLRPSWGASPLVVLGGAIVLCIVLLRLWVNEPSSDYHEFAQGKEALTRVAEKAVAEKHQGTDEASALDEVRGARPGQASLDLLSEYTANRKQAPDFKAFIARSDPADVCQKLNLGTEEKTIKAVRKNLPQVENAPVPPRPNEDTPHNGPVWPVILAGAAFLYLWWLTAILFDLSVVWHHYIRQAAILDRLNEIHAPASRHD